MNRHYLDSMIPPLETVPDHQLLLEKAKHLDVSQRGPLSAYALRTMFEELRDTKEFTRFFQALKPDQLRKLSEMVVNPKFYETAGWLVFLEELVASGVPSAERLLAEFHEIEKDRENAKRDEDWGFTVGAYPGPTCRVTFTKADFISDASTFAAYGRVLDAVKYVLGFELPETWVGMTVADFMRLPAKERAAVLTFKRAALAFHETAHAMQDNG